jgi:hypothetical protein
MGPETPWLTSLGQSDFDFEQIPKTVPRPFLDRRWSILG